MDSSQVWFFQGEKNWDTSSNTSSFKAKLCQHMRTISLIFLAIILILIISTTFAAIGIYWTWKEKTRYEIKSEVCPAAPGGKETLCGNKIGSFDSIERCKHLNQNLNNHKQNQTFPVIVRPPLPVVYAYSGDNITFSCIAIGFPVPDISWQYTTYFGKSKEVPNKCCTGSENGFGILHCSKVNESDSGMYSCRATNKIGIASAKIDAQLIVEDICKHIIY